ncbi:MAG: hypothetical protein ACSLFM_08560 [Tepidiformaceae bacterium]
MEAPADSTLLANAKSGDAQAFAALLSRHLPAAYDFAFHTAGETIARDAIIEACSRAALALRPLADADRAHSWLLGLTHAALIPRIGSVAPSPPAPTARHYAILDLHFRQGLDARDLAASLGISESSATITLERVIALAGDPAPVLRAIPAVPLPPGLLEGATAAALARWPVLDSIDPRVQPLPLPGASVQVGSGRGRRVFIAIPLLLVTALATAVGGLLLLPASPLAITGDSSTAPAAVASSEDASATPRPPLPQPSTTVVAASPTRAPSPTSHPASPSATSVPVGVPSSVPPAVSATGIASASVAPTDVPPPSSSPTGPTLTPTICPPALSPSVGTLPIVFAPSSASTAANTIRIQNNGCSAGSFTASIDLGATYLALGPASATVPAFGFVDLTLTASGADFPFPFEGTVGGRVRISTPAGQSFVNLTVTRVGSPPSVVAASVCTRELETGVAHEFTVLANDDFALASVTVTYVSGGAAAASLSESGGQWVATVVLPSLGTSFAVQARDAGGLTSNPFVFTATTCG